MEAVVGNWAGGQALAGRDWGRGRPGLGLGLARKGRGRRAGLTSVVVAGCRTISASASPR